MGTIRDRKKAISKSDLIKRFAGKDTNGASGPEGIGTGAQVDDIGNHIEGDAEVVVPSKFCEVTVETATPDSGIPATPTAETTNDGAIPQPCASQSPDEALPDVLDTESDVPDVATERKTIGQLRLASPSPQPFPTTPYPPFGDLAMGVYSKHTGCYFFSPCLVNTFAAFNRVTLSRSRPNRILIFPGAFNPPHVGHYTHLKYIFERAKDVLNIKAAITMPRDDDFVDRKFERRGSETKTLSKANRVKLWEHASPLPWNWIYDGTEHQMNDIMDEIQDMLGRIGYRIEYVCVTGPDYVTVDWGTTKRPWGDGSTITSDVCRTADFVRENRDKLNTIHECSPWEDLRIDETGIEDGGQRERPDTPTSLSSSKGIAESVEQEKKDASDETTDTTIKTTDLVKVCYQDEDDEKRVYFVPKDRPTKEYSSTALRISIQAHMKITEGSKWNKKKRKKKLELLLQDFALGPPLLEGLVRNQLI